MDEIINDEEYESKYQFKKNLIRGPCSKNTKQCFDNKYKTQNYGHMYNKEIFECCNNNLLYLLNKIKLASQKFGFTFFLDYGTLLGCLRNGKRIPWDIDIDIGIFYSDIKKIVDARKFLTNNGEIIQQTNPLMLVYYLSKKNNLHIDIQLYKKTRKNNKNIYVTSYSEKIPTCVLPEEDLFPLKEVEFEGMKVLIPNQSEKYIELNYGKDCIKNPITKLSYSDDYIKNGSKGDLPDMKKWEKIKK